MNKVKLLKKSGLVAIGLASLTSKKANLIVEGLVKKGKLTQKQGEVVARKMVARALKEEQRIRGQVLSEVGKSAKRVMAVTQSEAKRLMNQAKKAKPKLKKRAKPKANKRKRVKAKKRRKR